MDELWLFLVLCLPVIFALATIIASKFWPDHFARESHALDGPRRLLDKLGKYLAP